MELLAGEAEGLHLLVADLHTLRVASLIQFAADPQARDRPGSRDQVHDHRVESEGFLCPIRPTIQGAGPKR